MSGEWLVIAGGRVIDPANGVDAVGDVWSCDGRVVEAPAEEPVGCRRIDARGLVVMPGGVDMHCHIVGSKVTAARQLRPEDKDGARPIVRRPGFRSGTTGSVPTTFATGYQYAGLGYTTAIDAAIAPLGARQAHCEFEDTPAIDKGFLALVGNNHFAMDCIAAGESGKLRDYLGWLIQATRAFGFKAVNPGGVESWKQGRGPLATLDDEVPGFGPATPRRILEGLTTAIDAMGLPHALHLHGLNLGHAGNAAITLETMRAVEGRRAHFAHIQFHSYGGDPARPVSLAPGVSELVEYVNAHPNLTVDVGQVMFGETTSMTADGPVGEYLARVLGRKWVSHDVELETGCGIVPIGYDDRNAVHATQWAVGLEWFLRMEDPWRLALSTDHPNGGSFVAYPKLIALLMEKARRDEVLSQLPERVRKNSGLGDLDREYSLAEIAIITRAAPARILGLGAMKGHLGPGADADVTCYQPDDDRERMFALPRYVVKGGTILVDDTELVAAPIGVTLRAEIAHDPAIEAEVSRHFDRWASIRFANFAVQDWEVGREHVVRA
jgi:formylmethanofuran dehydrogenase subunit A